MLHELSHKVATLALAHVADRPRPFRIQRGALEVWIGRGDFISCSRVSGSVYSVMCIMTCSGTVDWWRNGIEHETNDPEKCRREFLKEIIAMLESFSPSC